MTTIGDIESVKRRLKFDYLKIKNEHNSKSLEMYTQLLAHFNKPQLPITEMIQEATGLIQRQFRLRWVFQERIDSLQKLSPPHGEGRDLHARVEL